MKPYLFRPGIPAAGHISSRGFWHPGGITNCNKCEPRKDKEKK